MVEIPEDDQSENSGAFAGNIFTKILNWFRITG